MSNVERRYTPMVVELRADKDTKRIGGYASIFNKQSHNLGGFVEVVDPSAFNKSRGDGWPDVIARYNHDDNMLLGTVAAGTLRLNVDNVGLDYVVVPPSARADIVELVERGDIRKSSFAFRTIEDDWSLTEQNFPKRTLLAAKLVDVAPVNLPAYPDATAGLRSLANKFEAEFDEVRSLAEANELRKFFVRTDGPQPKKPSNLAQARLALLARRTDPYA